MVTENSDVSSTPSAAPDGSVRLVVHCRAHNPVWQKLQQAAKTAKLADDVAKLPLGSRVTLKAGGSVFEATLISNAPDFGSIEVVQDGSNRHFNVKYSTMCVVHLA